MFEHRKQSLISREKFFLRMAFYTAISLGIIVISLGLGVLGYRYIAGLSWIDALLNASMILGGMGPVNTLETDGSKLFASFYALFSGVVFLVAAGVLFAPLIHRLLHRFHLGAVADEE